MTRLVAQKWKNKSSTTELATWKETFISQIRVRNSKVKKNLKFTCWVSNPKYFFKFFQQSVFNSEVQKQKKQTLS